MFANAPEPSQQIPILYSILKDLGMSENRMSLEKAKAIRAKRELEQELCTFPWFSILLYSQVCCYSGY